MRLRRRRHVKVDGTDAGRVLVALLWRGEHEAAEAVSAAPRLLDRRDPAAQRALRMLADLRAGAPLNPHRVPSERDKIIVPLPAGRQRRA